MFCPQCGAPDQNLKTYCRHCGEWLAESSSKPEHRIKVITVFNGLNSLMALTAAIVLYSTYLGSPEAKWSIYVAGALCSVIAVHQLISFIFALGLRHKSQQINEEPSSGKGSRSEPIRQIEGRDTRRILDVPSVTETTTRILQEAPRQGPDTKPQG